ncbi:MAG: hypothetical protein RBU30_09350 [Polyangia bacterium]|jgi:hypothetical protein|nr:hypothetical protein [Polyangia bacterium]
MADNPKEPSAIDAPDPELRNPYGPPVQPVARAVYPTSPPMEAYQDDITSTEPTALVKAGAILTETTGVITALVGLQLLVTTVLPSSLELVPFLLLGMGFAAMFFGWKTMRTRGWGAIGAAVVCGLVALGMGYWVLLTASAGFFSLLALILPPLAVVSAVFAGLAVGHCRRADRARARLGEAGIDMTF